MFVKSQKISSAEDILEALVRFPCLSFEEEIINLLYGVHIVVVMQRRSFSTGFGANFFGRFRL